MLSRKTVSTLGAAVFAQLIETRKNLMHEEAAALRATAAGSDGDSFWQSCIDEYEAALRELLPVVTAETYIKLAPQEAKQRYDKELERRP